MTTAIRIALTALLLYFVYGETGPATTIALSLVVAALELNALSRNLLMRKLGIG